MMDINILKIILFSCESVAKDYEKSEELANILKHDIFPLSEDIINALSISFTNLLSYKVSQQMYQRHAIQMRIIETLRLCSTIEDVFGILDTHFKNINVASIAVKILIKNLTYQRLQRSSLETLIYLSNILPYLLHKDNQLKKCLNHITVSIAKHPSIEQSKDILENILLKYEIYLDKRSIEIIYNYHTKHLIEEPMIDDYCKYSNHPLESEFKYESCSKLLFNHIAKFPEIFQRSCIILKEMFIKLKYNTTVLSFTKLFMAEVMQRCENLQFLDLYPLKLQPCIGLMKIEPHLHSTKSKQLLFKFVKQISINNNDDLLILLIQYPSWLEILVDVGSVS